MDSISPFSAAQVNLEPFVKSRQETARIRRLLAIHLNAQLEHSVDKSLLDPISLVDESCKIKNVASYPRGLQRDYLKALRANIRARRDYEYLVDLNSGASDLASQDPGPLDTFLSLIKQRQRHERLVVLKDYADVLAHKAGALVQKIPVFLEESALPRISEDVIGAGDLKAHDGTGGVLKQLVHRLEAATLGAKMQLKAEQQLLSQVIYEHQKLQSRKSDIEINSGDKLQALNGARNELIMWVEEQLGKAGETSEFGDSGALNQHPRDENSTSQHLAEIQRRYAKYTQARKIFLDIVSRTPPTDLTPPMTSDATKIDPDPQGGGGYMAARVISPYLGDLITISNEQRSLIQQKSHLTITLAKHHKDALQVYDRLAEESHLLPNFPMPLLSKGSRTPTGLGDDMSAAEIPSTSHRANMWTFAAERMQNSTTNAVFKSIGEGRSAVEEASKMMSIIRELVGQIGVDERSKDNSNMSPDANDDIWIPLSSKDRNVTSLDEKLSDTAMVAGDIWGNVDGNLGNIK